MKKILNIAYYCGKICEGVIDDGTAHDTYREVGLVNVHYVEDRVGEMLSDIQASPECQVSTNLQRRLRFDFEPIQHALKGLAAFLEQRNPPEDARITATVFARYTDNEVPKKVREYGYEADKSA